MSDGRKPTGGVAALRDGRARRGGSGLRSAGSRVWHLARILTAAVRPLPDFLVIGAQRCGTTSLHGLLNRHPHIAPAWGKEVHYFDRFPQKSRSWYRSHFPSGPYRRMLGARRGGRVLTFEATPDYLFYPQAAGRAASLLPNARLIVLLRNPVDRAYSGYRTAVGWGVETLSFGEAVQREEERLRLDYERMRADPRYVGRNFHYYSYLARGRYREQLERWLAVFPRQHLLVLRSEDYFAQPADALARVSEFLGIRLTELTMLPRASARRHPPMDPGVRRELLEYFAPHNRRLGDLLGTDFHWSE